MNIIKRDEEVIATLPVMNRCRIRGWNKAKFRQYLYPDATSGIKITRIVYLNKKNATGIKLSDEKY